MPSAIQKAQHTAIPDPSSARLFYCPEAAAGASRVSLCADEAHHALHVLRLRDGASIRLMDGCGNFYSARLHLAGRRNADAEIISRQPSHSEPRSQLILVVGLIKGRKADLLIQKSVELGVCELRFFAATRSVARSHAAETDEGRPRWEQTVVAACKQCERATLMPVREYASLGAALENLPPQISRLVFWEQTARDMQTHNATPPAAEPIPHSSATVALIGPEGGFTTEEVLQVQSAGFQTCSLGPRILRAETAAIAAAAILLYRSGDLGVIR